MRDRDFPEALNLLVNANKIKIISIKSLKGSKRQEKGSKKIRTKRRSCYPGERRQNVRYKDKKIYA